MNRLLAAVAVFLALAGAAWGQGGAIQQSGAITAHHVGGWFGNGVLGDAGTPASPGLSAVGIYDGAQCPFGVSSQTQPGGPVGPYSIFEICQTNTTATLIFAGVGQTGPSVYFNIGGINYGFPGPGNGNVDGPPSSTNGDFACFNTGSGTLLKDCGTLYSNIQALPAAAVLTGTEAVPVTQSGAAVQSTPAAFSTLANSPTTRAAYPAASTPLSGSETVLGTQSSATVKMTTQSIAGAPTLVTIVADLPTCNSGQEGARAAVTDALYPSYLSPAIGGGSVHAGVGCNGTAWLTGY